jgi:anaerobic magnesium-protoporphyrin IX monomethyl ester cyclase
MRSRWVPTGLAYLGTALKRAGHQVRICIREEQLMKRSYDWNSADTELRELLSEYRPDLVGLSVMTPAIFDAGTIAKWSKEICGERVLVAAGGAHPTAIPEQTLRECPAIDLAVIGEAEQTLVQLAEHRICSDIEGIVYRDGDRFVHTPPRQAPQDLDALGPPAYELFDMNFYTTPDRSLIRWLKLSATNIHTARGCPNRCRFCAGHLVAGLGVRHHSLEYVLLQVLTVVNKFGVEAINFNDDTLGTDRERLLELCELLRKNDLHRRIRWVCCLRVDQVDPELLSEMKRSGCFQIEYGFECGSDEALGRIGKNSTMELNRRAVKLTREAGIRIFADIMVGLPGETEKEFRQTVRFVRWAKPDVLSPARLCPLPGTPIFDALDKEVRDSIDWAEYTFLANPSPSVNLTAMDADRFEKLYRKVNKRLFKPNITWAWFRDAPTEDPEDREYRRYLRWRLIRFALRHPIRAARAWW